MLIGKVDGDPNDKKEERKDKIGGCATVPGCMPQRRINMVPGARIVHQDHGGNGYAPEYIQ